MREKTLKISTIILLVGTFLFNLYKYDLRNWTPNRVENKSWIYDKGFFMGGVINRETFSVSSDTLIMDSDHFKCLIIGQYFDTLILQDIETQKLSYYEWL